MKVDSPVSVQGIGEINAHELADIARAGNSVQSNINVSREKDLQLTTGHGLPVRQTCPEGFVDDNAAGKDTKRVHLFSQMLRCQSKRISRKRCGSATDVDLSAR
jgi:hypothetical protein